jgi:hypothetical protein
MIIPLQPKALAVAGSLGVIAFATFIDLFHPEPSLITLEKVIFCGIDNLGHSILAALLWLGITAMQLLQTGAGNTKSVHCSGFELLMSAMIASLVDIDHYWSALINSHSISLHAATHLQSRDLLFFHKPGITILLALTIGVMVRRRWGVLLFVAFMSHEMRDATRTGFALWPYTGFSLPLPYLLYLGILGTCTIPLAFVLNYLSTTSKEQGLYRVERGEDVITRMHRFEIV